MPMEAKIDIAVLLISTGKFVAVYLKELDSMHHKISKELLLNHNAEYTIQSNICNSCRAKRISGNIKYMHHYYNFSTLG